MHNTRACHFLISLKYMIETDTSDNYFLGYHWVWQKISGIIIFFVIAIGFIMVSCGTFFINYEIDDNFFQLIPLSIGVVGVTIIALLSFMFKKYDFRIQASDVLFFIVILYCIIRYDYKLQLANWKIINALLLFALWVATRTILSHVPAMKNILCGVIVCMGGVLAAWGLLQLYGILESNHRMFAVTGPFRNPGPYSGYITILFSVTFGCMLQARGKIRYLCSVVLFVMLCVLPATMSRSSWLALFVSCSWLLAMYYGWWERLIYYIKRYRVISAIGFVSSLCIMMFFLLLLFHMKEDSAKGRFFIWKNSYTVIENNPLFGSGIGSFPCEYGKVQSDYFQAGNYTETEERVAGSPKYAFNEYLQMAVEGGIVLLSLFLILVCSCLRSGISSQKYDVCAGIISLAVFSFSSYPLQLLPFTTIGVLLLAGCVSETNNIPKNTVKQCWLVISLSFSLLVSAFGVYFLYGSRQAANALNYICYFRSKGLYADAVKECGKAYSYMKHNPDFLIEYAKCLSAEEKDREAIKVLERAKLVCCHPVIWNIQGKIYQSLRCFNDAERCFKKAVHLLPVRIYPYYLLAKLYSEPSFYHEKEMYEMIDSVLFKTPKVPSELIDEMRVEVRRLRNSKTAL